MTDIKVGDRVRWNGPHNTPEPGSADALLPVGSLGTVTDVFEFNVPEAEDPYTQMLAELAGVDLSIKDDAGLFVKWDDEPDALTGAPLASEVTKVEG